MFQEVLALLTVAGAIVYLIWGVYRTVTPSKDKQSTMCGGCYAANCSVKTIKQQANKTH